MKQIFGDRPSRSNKRSAQALISEADYYGPTELQTRWQELGFASLQDVRTAIALVSCSTRVADRQTALIPNRMPVHVAQPPQQPLPQDALFNMPAWLLCPTVPVWQTSITPVPDLSVTRQLSHVLLPMGRTQAQFRLKLAVDSCAGINLGDLQFHLALRNLYPDSVAQLIDLRENSHEISIGGVEEQGSGVSVTHVISYWLPFVHQGQPARVAFGLAENLATTALVGVGFLKATQAIMSFTAGRPELFLQAIETSLALTMEIPHKRPIPRQEDAAKVYTAPQAATPRQI